MASEELREKWIAALHEYLSRGEPVSIADRSGVYADVELEIERLTGADHAVLYNSGTSALLAAYWALGVRPGDEVIAPAWTFFSSVSPLLLLGATPVLVDVDPANGNIALDQVAARVTERTKVLCVVHLWGHPADAEAARVLADRFGLALLEDCAHAPLSQVRGRPVGQFGDAAIWSFQDQKIISGGEGGALITSDEIVAERAVLFGHFGRHQASGSLTEAFWETGVGIKLRMHPLSAVMIRSQLGIAEAAVRQRDKAFRDLAEGLKTCGWCPYKREEYVTQHCYYTFKLHIESSREREEVIARLKRNGLVAGRASSKPLHHYPLFQDAEPVLGSGSRTRLSEQYPAAERLWRESVSIRTGSVVDDPAEFVDRIWTALRR